MFTSKSKEEKTHPLDSTITATISAIAGHDEGSEQHTAAVNSLKILMELRAADKAVSERAPISSDVMAAAATHLLGIVMILGFEKANVITSKSLSFIPKIKI